MSKNEAENDAAKGIGAIIAICLMLLGHCALKAEQEQYEEDIKTLDNEQTNIFYDTRDCNLTTDDGESCTAAYEKALDFATSGYTEIEFDRLSTCHKTYLKCEKVLDYTDKYKKEHYSIVPVMMAFQTSSGFERSVPLYCSKDGRLIRSDGREFFDYAYACE